MTNNANVTVPNLIKQLSLSVSDQTIYNFCYKFAPAMKCPFLNEDNKGRRLCWAEGLLEMCLKQLDANKIFSTRKGFFSMGQMNTGITGIKLAQTVGFLEKKRFLED